MKKIKSTEIIENRKKYDKEIKKMWNIIRTENLIDKNATRNYDMKALLDTITEMSNNRIQTKLDSIAINLGFKSRKDFPKESIYPIIYTLSEKNEYLVQLGSIPTINPGLKAKLGKKKLFKCGSKHLQVFWSHIYLYNIKSPPAEQCIAVCRRVFC